MSVNLSIKEVPDTLADRLRLRAELNHRSLQGELMAIIERAANELPDAPSPGAGVLSVNRERQLRGWKTVEDLVAERRAVGWQPAHPPGIPLAVDIIRADRDTR
jgi:plasmid stability protein